MKKPLPRFSIFRMRTFGGKYLPGWYLRDFGRPSYLGTYPSHELALRGMDNIVRRERGMPARIAVTSDEILSAMSA